MDATLVVTIVLSFWELESSHEMLQSDGVVDGRREKAPPWWCGCRMWRSLAPWCL